MRKFLLVVLLLLINILPAQHKTSVYLETADNPGLQKKIESHGSLLLTEFNRAFHSKSILQLPDNILTQSGRHIINVLFESESFYCEDTEVITNLVRRSDGKYEIRNMSLVFDLEDEDLHYEEGVIIFTPTGLIDDFYFGLESHRYKSLLNEGNTVSEFRQRQIILDFVENFRTAYNRKDLQYIKKVFSDNALIIVGKVVEIDPNSPDMLESSIEGKRVELIRLNKSQYIDRLTRVFTYNTFIKVGFDEIEIFKHPLFPEIFGVTLLQHWTSSNYSDVGYIFLMMDFKDEENPRIHVRTWQPKKYTPEDEIISLGDFEIID